MSDALRNREPVSTYHQAIYWLIGEYVDDPWFLNRETPMPAAARVVAEIFWVTEVQLRKDLKKDWGQNFGSSPQTAYLPYRRTIS